MMLRSLSSAIVDITSLTSCRRILLSQRGMAMKVTSDVKTATEIRSKIGEAKVTLPSLSYAYDALEPYISTEIMTLHHTKHHQTYVNKWNELMSSCSDGKSITEAVSPAMIFNGGGHINHALFFENLAPAGSGGGGAPEGDLGAAIDKNWSNFEMFRQEFSNRAIGVMGSGWVWLVADKNGDLRIEQMSNQDPILEGTPLLGIDVWEHAYYPQYKNVRPDYINAIWKVINWKVVAGRYESS